MDELLVLYFVRLHEAIYDEDEELIVLAIISILNHLRDLFIDFGETAKEELIPILGDNLIETEYMYDDNIMKNYLADIEFMLLVYIERITNTIKSKKEELQDEENIRDLILGLIYWEILRFTGTEYNDLEQASVISATKQIADDNNMIAMKRWVAVGDGKTCSLCESLNGTELPIEQPFMSNGDIIETVDGLYQYSYIPRIVAIAHPNDRCTIETFLIPKGGK